MDFSSSWSVAQLGLIIAAPFCHFAGFGFAFSTLTSPFHHPLAKLFGCVGSVAIALVTGDLIRQPLTPFFWPMFGTFWCAGFGFLLVWVLISIIGERRDDDFPHKPERSSPFDHQSKPKKNRPRSPFKHVGQNNRKDGQ